MNRSDIITSALIAHQTVIAQLEPLLPAIYALGERLRNCLNNGNKILLMGNGGSAADCQHIAAEIVGRYKRERRGLPAIALTTDTSILTSVGNDYGFQHIFSRQIEALCARDDVVIGLSTSGNSANVVAGIEAAKQAGAYTVGLTGAGGGRLADLCDVTLAMPSSDTPRIQEAHILIGHILCELAEAE
ncbi:MAG TPA: D-sedoheptulose 7-phosphate isomerase [Methylophilaceae bacterium]|nr:D-sedoheptulose 7-phosphate isomerase [Methylophilaceae bacterium]HQR61265.1 D-sedoheptulose 7-phosphate isomerase [Methylophilaceae bacterium]